MQRLLGVLLIFILAGTACTFEVQMQPQVAEQTQTLSTTPMTQADVPGNPQVLEGPDINYNGIRFTLDPALGPRVYVFAETLTIDGATAQHTRFALTHEEYCQTWCVQIYPVAEFEQAFGSFVFPPAGYRGGAAVVFKAQEKALSFQNGSGDRALEMTGQSQYAASNEALRYVFRGYSADQQYAVYVEIPARAANLPDVAPTMTTDFEEIAAYNQQAAEAINALTLGDFTPNLDLLDALVASIQVGTP